MPPRMINWSVPLLAGVFLILTDGAITIAPILILQLLFLLICENIAKDKQDKESYGTKKPILRKITLGPKKNTSIQATKAPVLWKQWR